MNITDQYFNWICRLVTDRKHPKSRYRSLLEFLYDSDFMYLLDNDVNRANDGMNLRYRFAYDNGYPSYVIDENFDRYCNVLEMIAALAFRVEEQIMNDPEIGDRTPQWFWMMIKNLGLIDQTNDNFDELYSKRVIERFLNRDYSPDGEGGLIVLSNCRYDLRTVEIWDQMMWYLNTLEQ